MRWIWELNKEGSNQRHGRAYAYKLETEKHAYQRGVMVRSITRVLELIGDVSQNIKGGTTTGEGEDEEKQRADRTRGGEGRGTGGEERRGGGRGDTYGRQRNRIQKGREADVRHDAICVSRNTFCFILLSQVCSLLVEGSSSSVLYHKVPSGIRIYTLI